MKPVDRLTDDEFAHLVQRAAALPDAPAALIRAAIDLWPAAHAAAAAPAAALKAAAQAGLRLVAAVLSFDSWAQPAVARGMRAGPSETRHLLFSAMGRDIDLRISPLADRFALTGQILGPDDAGTVTLCGLDADGGEAQSVALDALGEFRIDGVAPGRYRLTLTMGGDELVLAPLEVGEPPH